MIRVTSLSRTIAPSILASSRRPVEVNGTSRVKPPVQMPSTVLSWPSTISAPVRPRRMRSRPSRSGGARRDLGQGGAQPQLLLGADRGPPRQPPRRWRRPESVRASSGQSRRWSPDGPQPARSPTSESSAQRGATSDTSIDAHPLDPPLAAGRPLAPRPGRPRPGSRAGPPRRSAAAGRAPCAARRPGPSSPIATTPRGAGRPVEADASATAIARSVAGSTSRAPPTVEVKTSCWWSRIAAVLVEHREHHRHPRGVEPARRTSWSLGGGVGHQRLHLGEQRAAALHGDRHAGAGDLLVVVLDEEAGRVGDRGDAVGGEVEAADLVDRAEPVLHRADHPEAGVAVALEVEDDVDDVLEDAGAGDASRPW